MAWGLPHCMDLARAAPVAPSELCPRAAAQAVLTSKPASLLPARKGPLVHVSNKIIFFWPQRAGGEAAFPPPCPGAVAEKGSAVQGKAGCKLRESRWFQDQAHHVNEKPNC